MFVSPIGPIGVVPDPAETILNTLGVHTKARAGNDRLLGFGSGTFRGGNGTDTIRFNAGSYTIAAEGKDFLITANSIAMHVSSFEKIGSAFGAEQLVALRDGILTIDGERTARYA